MKNEAIGVFLMILVGCSPSSQTKYGPNGKSTSGKSTGRCTYPKNYTKALDLTVKGAFDSLSTVPKPRLDLSIKQTVTKLAEYSSDGLGFALVQYYICELAISAGLDSAQKERIIMESLKTWQTVELSKTGKSIGSIDQKGGVTINGPVTGSIVADKLSLSIPEDKEIIENNYNMVAGQKTYRDTLFNTLSLEPKLGRWSNVFVAFPLAEANTVRGGVSGSDESRTFNNEIVLETGEKIVVKTIRLESPMGIPGMGIKFLYQQLPSVLFFGDFYSPEKQYMLTKQELIAIIERSQR